jgi:protein-S-isoprenylcysteine O-methyltransferase Ste14
MRPWFAKAIVLAASVMLIVIRAPHGQRSRSVEIAKDRKGLLEVVLLSIAMPGFFVPLVWIFTDWFAFADYSLNPALFSVGVIGYVVGLWIFHRSHVDLGTNWSVTLQIRQQHRLVTEGIYRRIRHPMYLALFLYSFGQLLVLPNWIAGPSYLVTFGILFVLRLQAEERMMLEEFGDAYASYMRRTKRLVPGLW